MYKKLPNFSNYLINSEGQIKNIKRNKLITHSLHSSGYYVVKLVDDEGNRKTFKLHRLLAILFIPNPDNLPCVNHKDEDKLNNSINNLEWCDITYNNTYGTRIERAKNGQSIYGRSNMELYQIKNEKIINVFHSIKEASEITGIKACNISNVLHGRQKTTGGYKWILK